MIAERQWRRTFLQAEARTSFWPDEEDNPPPGPLLPPQDLYRLALAVPTPDPEAGCPPRWAAFWAARLVRSGDVGQVPVEGGLLLELPDGRHFVLNEAGALVWNRLIGDRTLADVIADLGLLFDVDEEVLRNDVFHIIRTFVRESLLI